MISYKKSFVTLVLLALSINSFGQEEKCPPLESEELQELFTESVTLYQTNQIRRAVGFLSQIIRNEPDFAPAHYLLGLIYVRERSFRPDLALSHFEVVYEECPEIDPYLYFHLGNLHYFDGTFEKAAKMYERFISYIDEISDEDYFEAVEKMEQATFLHEGYSNPVPFNPVVVEGISSGSDEYLMTVSADGEIALYTRRVEVKDHFFAWDTQINYKEKFMASYRLEKNKFDSGNPLPQPFNQQYHEGSPSLTYDNRTLYYTACEFEKNYYNCNIHVAEFINGAWKNNRRLCSNVNSHDAWESQPSISPDGQTLFFVSNRKGRYDIFVSEKDSEGNWMPAKPLGHPINTEFNERSPYMHLDGRTLYFSSDGHLGFGGYDLFFSRMDDNGNWQQPVNLGYPINTAADETGIVVSTDGSTAFFASTRFKETGEWNIYSFELYEQARPEKVLFITGEVQSDSEDGPVDALLQLRNLETMEIRNIDIDSITGQYAVAELFKSDFLLTLKKEDHAYTSRLLTKEDTLLHTPARVDIDLIPVEVGKTYEIQDIFFDYDKYNLRNESKIVLYTVVEFLTDHPDVKLEIRGHTDNIGGKQYNKTLSDNRARSVYDFLLDNGISPHRLQYKGFGQSKPIATNETEEGRAKNRRTEFVILDR